VKSFVGQSDVKDLEQVLGQYVLYAQILNEMDVERSLYYLHATPIHISLVDNKVWVQYDDTEEGVATDLVAEGVSKDDIVLGFRHPKIRQHTGFAMA
jgi:XisI protein/XisH protein